MARVHSDRTGQATQSSGEKSMWIMTRPRALRISRQRMLFLPCGQVATHRSHGKKTGASMSVVDGSNPIHIVLPGNGRLNVDHQMRQVIIPGLGEMGFVADPALAALRGKVRLWLVRGLDLPTGRWHVLEIAQLDLSLHDRVMDDPEAAEQINGMELSKHRGNRG